MKYIIALISPVFLMISSCSKDSCEATNGSGAACIEIYAPVCGCNNVTYSTGCHAESHGITEYTTGECN